MELEQHNKQEELLECLSILEKLISNIVTNPMEPKFRTIKTTNNAIKSKVLNVQGVDKVIKLMGYQLDGEFYKLSDDNLARMLSGAPFIDEHRRLLAAKMSGPDDYKKELAVIQNHREMRAEKAKQAKEQDRLKQMAEADKRERAHMKVDTTQSRQLGFGVNQKTWSDIGVDLCNTKKGG